MACVETGGRFQVAGASCEERQRAPPTWFDILQESEMRHGYRALLSVGNVKLMKLKILLGER
jgi:hypothetical protein